MNNLGNCCKCSFAFKVLELIESDSYVINSFFSFKENAKIINKR